MSFRTPFCIPCCTPFHIRLHTSPHKSFCTPFRPSGSTFTSAGETEPVTTGLFRQYRPRCRRQEHTALLSELQSRRNCFEKVTTFRRFQTCGDDAPYSLAHHSTKAPPAKSARTRSSLSWLRYHRKLWRRPAKHNQVDAWDIWKKNQKRFLSEGQESGPGDGPCSNELRCRSSTPARCNSQAQI